MNWHCWFAHDPEWVQYPDPRPREYRANGRPKLRKAWMRLECTRCGKPLSKFPKV